MARHLFCALFVVCVFIWSSCGKRQLPEFSGDEEAEFGMILPHLYNVLPYMYYRLLDMDMSEEAIDRVVEMMEEYDIQIADESGIFDNSTDNSTRPSSDCIECRAFIGALQTAMENNNYTVFEEFFLDLCAVVVNNSDELGTPEQMCPGITENYLDHVYFILSITDMDQTDICVLWNECIYNEFDPSLPEETLVCRPPGIPDTSKNRPRMERQKPYRHLNNTIKIAHLTDIHIDLDYDIGEATHCGLPTCCRDMWPGTGSAGYWGDYQCNQPITLTDVMLQNLAALEPDFIMNTGDNPPHTVWLDTLQSQLASSLALSESFKNNLPGIKTFYALGNHDIMPCNLYFRNRSEVQQANEELVRQWGPLGGFGAEQIETFEKAAYYTILLQPGLRLMAYNSNYGWLENFYSILRDAHPDYEEMKVWMENTLADARLNGEKVILLAHHPTGASQGNNEYSCFITDIHARYGDIIKLHLSGHKHGDLYRLVRNLITGETKGVQISSPAATTRSSRNPSIRIFYLDHVTFDVLDADTYRVNFTLNAGDPDGRTTPILELGYRFTEEYDMVDLSPASFQDLILRLETDDALFDKYLWNEGTGNPDKVDDCDEECRIEEICLMKNTAYPGYLACMGEI